MTIHTKTIRGQTNMYSKMHRFPFLLNLNPPTHSLVRPFALGRLAAAAAAAAPAPAIAAAVAAAASGRQVECFGAQLDD